MKGKLAELGRRWALLSLGLVLILLWSTQGKGFTKAQLAFLSLACIIAAGIYTWLINL
ncbi:MAG: hypothetical protein J7M05_10120 [Anaerolineae bacterium]|nr:hypothetical protein [Anaerolineae bacterium]